MLKVRLATEIGTVAFLRVFDMGGSEKRPCAGKPKGKRGATLTYHNAKEKIKTTTELGAFGFVDRPPEDDPRWPSTCGGCGKTWAALGIEGYRQVFHDRLYDTPDGELHPGDMFWATWDHWEEPVTGRTRNGVTTTYGTPTACPHGWSNCDGRHLHVLTPDGHEWDIDGRASNCTILSDQTHRCWVRSGVPPNVTAGKGGGREGHTCSAGAGSIAAPNYHGFLRDGAFT